MVVIRYVWWVKIDVSKTGKLSLKCGSFDIVFLSHSFCSNWKAYPLLSIYSEDKKAEGQWSDTEEREMAILTLRTHTHS